MPLEFRPKFDKIVELLLYLAHKRPGTDKYWAMKLFYLADREHLVRHGRPITSEAYFALKFGPVASKAMDLIEGDPRVFAEAGLEHGLPFDVVQRERPGQRPIQSIGKPHREVDADVFSRSDLAVFDEILKLYGDASFDKLYQTTHAHMAWKRAWEGRLTGTSRAPIPYSEMIDSADRRRQIEDDFASVSARM